MLFSWGKLARYESIPMSYLYLSQSLRVKNNNLAGNLAYSLVQHLQWEGARAVTKK